MKESSKIQRGPLHLGWKLFLPILWTISYFSLFLLEEIYRSIYYIFYSVIPGGPKITEQSIFLGLCSDQQLSFFTLLDRTFFPCYNNTKIIKFGWKLFILWVISYGLSFSGFAINFSLVGGPPKHGTVDFLWLCSDVQLFFSPCWIEHLFLVIMTPRS